MKTTNNFEPVGKRFYSQSQHREMMIVTEGELAGWIVYKHPDGQWVTLRKATPKDLADINAVSATFAPPHSTQSKHTPGPWEIRPVSNWAAIAQVGHMPHATVGTSRHQDSNEWTPEDAANARLIAAAPDLFAALERLLAAPDLNLENLEPETLAAIEHAGQTLARARGETP